MLATIFLHRIWLGIPSFRWREDCGFSARENEGRFHRAAACCPAGTS